MMFGATTRDGPDDRRAAHLQSVSDPGRVDRGLDRAAAAHRGDGVQRGLRQPVSLSRVLRQPLRRQGLLPAEPALSRHREARATTSCCATLPRRRQSHGLRVIMDLVVNHTAKDSELAARRPQWFARDASGEIQSPFAVDPDNPEKKTVWGDLAELDYRPPQRDEIVAYFEELVRHYVGLGFGGFRCDAAYKVPAEAWRRLIDAAKACRPRHRVLRRKSGGARGGGAGARPGRLRLPVQQPQMVGFREPVAARPVREIPPYRAVDRVSREPRYRAARHRAAGGRVSEDQIEARYRQAYAFAAAFSTGVMMPMGFEYGWSRRISVVPNGDEDQPEPPRFDLQRFIAAVNRMKAAVPALNEEGPQRRLSPPDDPLLALLRQTESGAENGALILVNTQEREAREIGARGLLSAGRADQSRDRLALDEVLAGRRATSRCRRGSGSRRSRCACCTRRCGRCGGRRSRRARCRARSRHRPEWRPDARILIEDVWPEIDCGRYPIKRVVGDEVDGMGRPLPRRPRQDRAGAQIRRSRTRTWREAPFALFDNDRWMARFRPDRVGRWRYTVEAWTDHFASWRADWSKKQRGRAGHRARTGRGRASGRGSDQRTPTARRGAAARDRDGFRAGRCGRRGRADAVGRIAGSDGARR